MNNRKGSERVRNGVAKVGSWLCTKALAAATSGSRCRVLQLTISWMGFKWIGHLGEESELEGTELDIILIHAYSY